jgi:hypothetical protein
MWSCTPYSLNLQSQNVFVYLKDIQTKPEKHQNFCHLVQLQILGDGHQLGESSSEIRQLKPAQTEEMLIELAAGRCICRRFSRLNFRLLQLEGPRTA